MSFCYHPHIHTLPLHTAPQPARHGVSTHSPATSATAGMASMPTPTTRARRNASTSTSAGVRAPLWEPTAPANDARAKTCGVATNVLRTSWTSAQPTRAMAAAGTRSTGSTVKTECSPTARTTSGHSRCGEGVVGWWCCTALHYWSCPPQHENEINPPLVCVHTLPLVFRRPLLAAMMLPTFPSTPADCARPALCTTVTAANRHALWTPVTWSLGSAQGEAVQVRCCCVCMYPLVTICRCTRFASVLAACFWHCLCVRVCVLFLHV